MKNLWRNITALLLSLGLIAGMTGLYLTAHAEELDGSAIVAADKESLAIGYAEGDGADHVTGDLTLPLAGGLGSVVTWQSNTPAVITADGKVTRPAADAEDAQVTLTAAIVYGEASDTKEFTVTVLKQQTEEEEGPQPLFGPMSELEWVGNGSSGQPYQVSSAAHLAAIAEKDLSAHYIQTAAIDLDAAGYTDWTPIGTDTTLFTGTYDGGGFSISNLTINNDTLGDVGLFGYVGSAGVLKNITVQNGSVRSTRQWTSVGGLTGGLEGKMIDCAYGGSANGVESSTGGLIGFAYSNAEVTGSFSSGSVNSSGANDSIVGGIIGYNSSGTVRNCYSTASVSCDGGSWSYIGGLIGQSDGGSVVNCYSTGSAAGGAGATAGGLIGKNSGASVSNCYYLDTAATASDGGTALSEAQIKQRASCSDWDFDTVWKIGEGVSSPTLRWQPWTPDERITAACDALDWDDIKGANSAENDVTADLVLHTSGAESTAISWSAAPAGFINTETGEVTTPLLSQGNQNVTLTASVSYAGGTAQTKDFTLTIKYVPVTWVGDGLSADTAYQVSSAAHLDEIRTKGLGAHYIQTTDIDLAGIDWTPIGINVPTTNRFNGSYDGGGYAISNLTIETDTVNLVGLFGVVGDDGRLDNITLENASIRATHTSGVSTNVGSLAGYNRGTISNCEVEAEVIGGKFATVGGLTGSNQGFISQSHSVATVSGKGATMLGGLTGRNDRIYGTAGGVIDQCSSGGSVSVEDPTDIGPRMGGFAGNVSSQAVVTNSFSTADVRLEETIECSTMGGFVGEVYNPSTTITNCYSTGTVVNLSTEYYSCTGGFAGFIFQDYMDDGVVVKYCHSTGDVSGNNSVGGFSGAIYTGVLLENCYSTGDVSGMDFVGGVSGEVFESTMKNCYSTGAVEGAWAVGGVAGSVTDGSLESCYSTSSVTGSGKNIGGIAGWTNSTVKDNRALNPSVIASDNAGRIIGTVDSGATISGNMAWAFMPVNGNAAIAGGAEDDNNGVSLRYVQLCQEGTWTPFIEAQDSSGNAIWDFAEGSLPVLSGAGGTQDASFPPYLIGYELISISPVNNVTVPYGTALPQALAALPGTTTVADGNGQTHTVALNWTIAGYSGDIPGDYTAAGTFDLPAGVEQTIPATELKVTATLTVKAAAGGGGGGGSGTPAQNQNATISGGGSLPVKVDAGRATLDLSALSGSLSAGRDTVVEVPSIQGVTSYTANLPTSSLSGSGGGSLSINTDLGSLTLPGDMLSATGLSGDAGITIGQGNKDSLPDDVKEAIGDRPILQLTLTIDGQQTDWENPDAPVTVSIPYTPTAEELAHAESIVIWYIDGRGNVVTIPNGRYDPATGMVTVSVTHFSDYAVAYNQVSFHDVAADAWYGEAVSFLAAREITAGAGGGNYRPEARLTRGAFIVMLMRAYDIAPDANPGDNFADAGDSYYTGYLAAAKRLGISSGVGNNRFAPEKEITRQELFTLLYNALQVIGRLPEGDSGGTLADFSDAGQIDAWAKEAMTLLVRTGTVGGSGGKLNPLDTTTRAEMAQVLYNLLSK